MAVTVEERFGSPRITTGSNPGVEREYLVEGTEDEIEAHNALLAAAPTTFDPWGTGLLFLPRTGISGLHQIDAHPTTFEATVHYSAATALDGQSFEFDTTGGTQRRMYSLLTRGRYKHKDYEKPAPDHCGAIGVNGDTVEGVDVPVPAFAFSVTRRLAPEVVTPDYLATLKQLTGSVNAAPISIRYDATRSISFAAGELRFRGVRGGVRGLEGYSLTFLFEESENDNDVTIKDIVGPIEKRGWDYLWVQFADATDAVAAAAIKRPQFVYVEQVSPEKNHSQLGLLA